MARKKKDEVKEQVKEQIQEVVNEQDNKQENKENNTKQNTQQNKQNKYIIVQDNVSRDTRTLEQKLQSYKRKLRRI